MATNPYLDSQAGALTNTFNRNLTQNVLPALNSGAIASGNFGSSRLGIAQGNAIGQMGQDLSNSLANLYGGAYENDMGRAMQMRGQDQSYALGQGNLGLGYYNATNANNQANNQLGFNYWNGANQYNLGVGGLNLGYQNSNNNLALGLGGLDNQRYGMDQNFYTNQRGQDLSQAALGANLANQGIQGQLGMGQTQYGIGQQQYTAPWQNLNNFSNITNQFTGLGGQTTNQLPNSPASNTLGGALLGSRLGGYLGNLGFGGSDPSAGFSGVGTGSNFGYIY